MALGAAQLVEALACPRVSHATTNEPMTRTLVRAEPIEHQVGADKTHNITLYDDDGTLLDVTGKTAAFKLYDGIPRRGRKPWKGNAVLTKTSAAGEITLTTGNAAVAILDTDLQRKSGAHWYVVLITTTASGLVAHRAEGEIFLRREPT